MLIETAFEDSALKCSALEDSALGDASLNFTNILVSSWQPIGPYSFEINDSSKMPETKMGQSGLYYV